MITSDEGKLWLDCAILHIVEKHGGSMTTNLPLLKKEINKLRKLGWLPSDELRQLVLRGPSKQ